MTLTWLPNVLTIARCGLAFGAAWLIVAAPIPSVWPAIAFILVAMTDFADGWAARKFDAVSAFGAFLDPVADKLLVGLGLLAISASRDWSIILLVPALLIITRDLIATGLRLVPALDMPVSRLAKWKTAIEMVGIVTLLLAGPIASAMVWTSGLVLTWLAAALSVYTLGLYGGAILADAKRPHS